MKVKYELQDKPNKSIRIEYKMFVRDIKIYVDDKLVGEAKNRAEIKDGKYITLENGHHLTVHFSQTWGQAGFDVYYDHAPVPGSLNTVEGQSQMAFGIFMFIGIINIIAMIVKLKFNPQAMVFYDSIGMFIFGVFFLSVGYFVKNGSFIATVSGTAIFILDFVVTAIMSAKQIGGAPPLSGYFFMKMYFSIYLVRICFKMKATPKVVVSKA